MLEDGNETQRYPILQYHAEKDLLELLADDDLVYETIRALGARLDKVLYSIASDWSRTPESAKRDVLVCQQLILNDLIKNKGVLHFSKYKPSLRPSVVNQQSFDHMVQEALSGLIREFGSEAVRMYNARKYRKSVDN